MLKWLFKTDICDPEQIWEYTFICAPIKKTFSSQHIYDAVQTCFNGRGKLFVTAADFEVARRDINAYGFGMLFITRRPHIPCEHIE